MSHSFNVKSSAYTGPLDLLLSLIEKRKLFINDISLSDVTEEYIQYVQTVEQFPLKDTAEFILVASTLLLIKSRSLLPSMALTEEETASIEDLERRLRLYQIIKERTSYLEKRYGAASMRLPLRRPVPQLFAPGTVMTVSIIAAAMQSVIFNLPKPLSIPQAIVKKIVSLEEVMTSLAKRIRHGLTLTFNDIRKRAAVKNLIVVNFLAVLELIRKGAIVARQDNAFSDIVLEASEPGIPDYSA